MHRTPDYMAYLNPRPHGQWLQEDYDIARTQPGTAEYLNSLLTDRDHSCPHPDKTKTRGVPRRLGFFRKTDDTHTILDTGKVCQGCYDLAVPSGFNTWSTAYKASANPMTEENQARRDRGENWAALSMSSARDYYPAMFQAGTEDEPDPMPITDRLLPTNAEARELWRYLQDQEQPFYVDQLHLTRPWDPRAANRQEEDQRVARENYLAYSNADRVFVGTGIGGAGVNTIVEQRVAAGRTHEVPANFGYNRDRAGPDELFTGPPTYQESTHDWV